MARWTSEADAIILEYINNYSTKNPDVIGKLHEFQSNMATSVILKEKVNKKWRTTSTGSKSTRDGFF